jgi:chromosome segregation and condensation protein ScpB
MKEKNTIEAIVFFENKSIGFEELKRITGIEVKKIKELAEELKKDYESRDTALEIITGENNISMQVKNDYVKLISKISENVELSKKAIKILGLIAKKKSMKQSELKNYFRGEIYSYVKELKEKEYINSEKNGLTRLLKPTKKFFETFQMDLKEEKTENL